MSWVRSGYLFSLIQNKNPKDFQYARIILDLQPEYFLGYIPRSFSEIIKIKVMYIFYFKDPVN